MTAKVAETFREFEKDPRGIIEKVRNLGKAPEMMRMMILTLTLPHFSRNSSNIQLRSNRLWP